MVMSIQIISEFKQNAFQIDDFEESKKPLFNEWITFLDADFHQTPLGNQVITNENFDKILPGNDFDFQVLKNFPNLRSDSNSERNDEFFDFEADFGKPFSLRQDPQDSFLALSVAEEIKFERLAELASKRTRPLSAIIDQSLLNLMKKRTLHIGKDMFEIFEGKYHIKEKLKQLSNIFLMKNSLIMHEFASFIFQKRIEKTPCVTSYEINGIFNDCLTRNQSSVEANNHQQNSYNCSCFFQEMTQNFMKMFTNEGWQEVEKEMKEEQKYPKKSDNADIFSFIDQMEIRFQIEWPLNLIITERNQRDYNEIINFLLKLTISSLALNSLFREINSVKTLDQLLKPFSLLRMEFSNFVRNVQNYAFNEAINSTYDGFEKRCFELIDERVKVINELTTLISAHQILIDTIKTRLLLTKKIILEQISKMLDQSLLFVLLFQTNQGFAEKKLMEDLNQLRMDFQRNYDFLTKTLATLAKNGQFQFLEPLIFSLNFAKENWKQ